MKERLESLMPGTKFVYNEKEFVILKREGNMNEVKDESGKHWAWPSSTKVVIQPSKYRL